MERVEVVQLLAVGREHDLTTRHRGHGQRRTTAGVTVEVGEYPPVEPDAVEEGLSGGHRVLADHRVDHEQDLVRGDRVTNVGGLRHHLRVHAEATGGVHDHDVVLAAAGLINGVAGHLDRV